MARTTSRARKPSTPDNVGRPTKIDQVVAHTEAGVPITAAERIVQLVRAGNYVETAAAAAGVGKPTFHQWLRTAAEAHGKLHRHERTTPLERKCMAFAAAIDEAQGATEAQDVAELARLGRPMTITSRREERDANGQLVRVVNVSEDRPADARVLQWRLERRFRRRWGPGIEVTGAEGGPIEVDASVSARDALGDVLATMASRLAAVQVVAAVEFTDVEQGPLLVATEERPGEPAD